MRNSDDLEIDPHEAAGLRSAPDGPPPVFLDVREPDEVAICRIDGSHHIPMNQIPGSISQVPKEEPLIIYCHHGMRSLQVVHFLRKKGYANTQSLKGGIDRWSVEIEPDVPRY